jgi:hypothetical protein
MTYEYRIEPLDVDPLNELGALGWRPVCAVGDGTRVLLVRETSPTAMQSP